MNKPTTRAIATITGENFQNRLKGINPSQTNRARIAM
jgi:hypothetical protein